MGCTVTAAFSGAFLILRHSDGLRLRKVWGWTLLFWGVADSVYLLSWALSPSPVMNMGAQELTTHELLLGNLLGWVLLLYPTEALRPGWMRLKTALWQLLPMLALVALDYVIPYKIDFIISLYPFALIGFLFTHVRVYKTWCEENFSTLDDIDVRWIMRYLEMLILVGGVYMFMCLTQGPARGFTQLWLTIYMFVYSTEQILFRKDPWTLVRREEKLHETESSGSTAELHRKLDRWMTTEKPYLNPDFQLADLGEVLHMNRTYISHFLKAEYGCTFYQFVNRYRIEEAKRLKLAHPDLKLEELAIRCGFSSRVVFSNVFTRETGLSPREWFKKM